jgi:hypothetical protein
MLRFTCGMDLKVSSYVHFFEPKDWNSFLVPM